mmetsp:Transcript_14863/g.22866  ORF Transcript_14863/g.22866 Transcript_14863/m.22866 type:complete len:165 (+) Transcript_14863:29-523(+)
MEFSSRSKSCSSKKDLPGDNRENLEGMVNTTTEITTIENREEDVTGQLSNMIDTVMAAVFDDDICEEKYYNSYHDYAADFLRNLIADIDVEEDDQDDESCENEKHYLSQNSYCIFEETAVREISIRRVIDNFLAVSEDSDFDDDEDSSLDQYPLGPCNNSSVKQ